MSAFDALNEHLAEVRPVVDEFCASHGFDYVDRRSLGRYPRIRIEKTNVVTMWFDLWMELDREGNRVETFRRELPYELSAGAYIDRPDGSRFGRRFQKSLLCFSGRPFEEVSSTLLREMQKGLLAIDVWDEKYLEDNGQEIQLGS
jgi:hypothetical protein